MSELTERLMKKFIIHDEDGAASAGSSSGAVSGASVTGNAGLSSLGPVPNGVSGMIGAANKKKKKGRECRSCGYVTEHDEVKICYDCGDRLPRVDERSMEERLADFRTQQINLSQGKNGFGWIEDAVSQIMNVMTSGHPEVLHEGDDLTKKELAERVKNMLQGFNNWRINRKEGNLF
jgi:ribosomal protein L37E